MTRRRKAEKVAAPKCAACGRGLPWLGGDARNKIRGRQGDGLVCGIKCGWRLAMMIVQSVPGVLDLLPPNWQHKGAAKTTNLLWLGEGKEHAFIASSSPIKTIVARAQQEEP